MPQVDGLLLIFSAPNYTPAIAAMTASKETADPRRHDLDNLRSFLTSLVIVHHAGAAYGGAGMGGLFKSTLFPSKFVSLPLWQFDAFCQTFFMGLFFWISGRVSAQSLRRLDKRGETRASFVTSKATRLLMPAIAYTVILNPLLHVLCLPEWDIKAVRESITKYFSSVKGIRGPVWYSATLFVFDALAATTLPRQPNQQNTRLAKRRYNFAAHWGWVAVAATSFLVRIWYPVGKTLWPLNIQAGYAAQYVFAYTMGQLSFAHGTQTFSGPFSYHATGSSRTTPPLLSVSILSVCILHLALAPQLLLEPDSWMKNIMNDISGGWSWVSMVYAGWNELSFALVGPVLMEYFYKWHRGRAASWIWQPRYSYAAFLFHYVVIITAERVVDFLLLTNRQEVPLWCQSSFFKAVGPVALTMAIGTISSAGSFVLGRLVVEFVPGMAKIL